MQRLFLSLEKLLSVCWKQREVFVNQINGLTPIWGVKVLFYYQLHSHSHTATPASALWDKLEFKDSWKSQTNPLISRRPALLAELQPLSLLCLFSFDLWTPSEILPCRPKSNLIRFLAFIFICCVTAQFSPDMLSACDIYFHTLPTFLHFYLLPVAIGHVQRVKSEPAGWSKHPDFIVETLQ